MKKIFWMLVSCLMMLSLIIASCAPKEEAEEKEVGKATVVVAGEEEEVEEEVVAPSPEVPQYGGTLTLMIGGEYWDLLALGKGLPHSLSFNRLWDGDWAKGPAGGYGTNEVLWDDMTNLFHLKTGMLAESWRFEIDSAAQTVTTIFQIREGVRYALTGSEAGRLVNGRELTADDVVWNMNMLNNDNAAMNYRLFPQIRGIQTTKIGPQEISVTHSFKEHLGNIMRMVDNHLIFPPELYTKYGTQVSQWKNAVGTGPFMITDSIPANMTTLTRNPNYWKTNPVGPGEGDRLPYIETIKVVVIPDRSTQLAAMRTANVDQMAALTLEEKDQMLQQCPELKWAMRGSGYILPAYMRVDRPPFDNVKVRQAVMMAIDMESINKSLYAGLGKYPSWPYYYTPAYADLYLGLDDPACPDSVRELFTYNPERAKELLAEAGYATGFKTSVTCVGAEADYYSIIKDQLDKVKIDLEIKVIEGGARMSVAIAKDYDMMVPGVSPPATYPEQYQYTPEGGYINGSLLDDPYVTEMAVKAREAALTDMKAAMAITKELQPYLQDLALVIQTPRYPMYNMWWPWLKNYSGETNVGYFMVPYAPYVWIDQDLKKSMGY